MQVAYGLFSRSDNFPAMPGQTSNDIRVGWGVVGIPECLRGRYRAPFSSTSPLTIDLTDVEERVRAQQVLARYYELTDKEILRTLVGLDLSYIWTDTESMGFDFRRPGMAGLGGVTFGYPWQSQPPAAQPRGLVERVDARSMTVFMNHGGSFKLPRGTKVLSISEDTPNTFMPQSR